MKHFIFQALEWDSYHGKEDNDYRIRIFGKTEEKESICAIVTDFQPFFYIKIPEHWKMSKLDALIKYITRPLKKYSASTLLSYTIEKKKQLLGFTADKLFTYAKLSFLNLYGFYAFSKIFDEEIDLSEVLPKEGVIKFEKYETNIDSILRCMHIRDLQSTGWIKISHSKINYCDEQISRCNIEFTTSYTNLFPYEKTSIAPLKIISFDLECYSEDGCSFPNAENEKDAIIAIGNTFTEYGQFNCYKKVIFTLDTCSKIKSKDGVALEIKSFEDEADMLKAWTAFIQEEDPDVITGYNIFGFDQPYLSKRAKLLDCYSDVSQLSRILDEECELKEKKLASSALGDNEMFYFTMTGRVQIDLMKVIQRDYKLDGYKLDNVVANFIKEKVTAINEKNVISTDSTQGLMVDSYISLTLDNKISRTDIGQKYKVIDVQEKSFTIEENEHEMINDVLKKGAGKIYWAEAKDDLSAKEMFQYQKQSAKERAIIAKYCLKDCELVSKLLAKLYVLTNNIGMANVCHVPLNYIFLRGQSIKSFSLIAKKCYHANYCMPVLAPDENEDGGYEGAIVFDPTPGIYFVPIFVNDYSSLYPSCIIEVNASHETLVIDKEYDNLPNYIYRDVTYNNRDGSTTKCRFARKKPTGKDILDGTMGIIPEILTTLLSQRKKMRKMSEEEKDPFKAKILDGLQLAYKITANSIYGYLGAKTSQLRCKEIAASTTAIGGEKLLIAKNKTESEEFRNYAYEKFFEYKKELDEKKDAELIKRLDKITKGDLIYKKKYLFKGEVIYGDTDSVFINFNIQDKNGVLRTDDDSLVIAMRLGMVSADYINITANPPHKINPEKVIWPFIMPAKKKYIGLFYEKNPLVSSLKCMGMVLKRRDNAPIVKEIFGSAIDIIIKKRNMAIVLEKIEEMILDVTSGKYPLSKFIITKTLRGNYKNPNSIAHKVLADRMGKRDPGSKPQLNDRIPFAYVINKKMSSRKNVLQGDLIDHPDYIIKNKLKLNYNFYITNQIMKPLLQILELVMFDPKSFFDNILEEARCKEMGVKKLTDFITVVGKEKKEYSKMTNAIYKFKDSGNTKPEDTSHLFKFAEGTFEEEPKEIFAEEEMHDVIDTTNLLKPSRKVKKRTINKSSVYKFTVRPGKIQYDSKDIDDVEF